MRKSHVRQAGICILVMVVAILTLAGNQFGVLAGPPLGVYQLNVWQFDCAHFRFQAESNPVGGYAAVRIWLNSPSGTPLVDSFSSGYPSYYAPLNPDSSNSFGIAQGNVSFPTQSLGARLYARVYRATVAAPGSYDGQAYQDTTSFCQTGVNRLTSYEVLCSSFQFAGSATPGWGFAGVRIWLGNQPSGTPIVDSFVSGYPSYFAPVQSDGTFSGQVSYASHPLFTQLYTRVYWAPKGGPGSYEGVFVDITGACPA